MALASSLKTVSAGVEMVFGSAAAISAAFGYTDRWVAAGFWACFPGLFPTKKGVYFGLLGWGNNQQTFVP